jgi:crotonobetainyl-CoA:carnitine CoA-transferase CaiB-like acyl-CoA transferase
MNGLLHGVTVVTMEHAVSAPYATRLLRDQGARVIKIERPDGGDFARGYDTYAGGLASYFVWLNRGKESVALDVKRADARAALLRLLGRADVFVQNLSPGAAGRLGLDAPTLRAADPRLVVCDISGYGPTGPYAHKRAYDLLVQAEGGLASVTGSPGRPAKAGISVADLATGTFASNAVLSALFARERTGEGAAVSVAMIDVISEWMTFSTLLTRATGEPQQADELRHPAIVPYDGYRTADGTVLVVGVQNDREWVRLADALGLVGAGTDERFATGAGRRDHRAEVDALVGGALAHLDVAAAEHRLEAAGIAVGRVRTSRDLLDHPQLAARGRWRDTPTPAGPVPVLLPPVTVEGHPVEYGEVPPLGAHTEAVLSEIGFSGEEIATLTTG